MRFSATVKFEWGQIHLIKYKYKYDVVDFFKYKYKYNTKPWKNIKYKYKYKYSRWNTKTIYLEISCLESTLFNDMHTHNFVS